jgi:predicted nucleic acid-binding protein
MGVILDTGIWVEVERGRVSPADVAAAAGGEPVYLTPVTIAELQYGLKRARSKSQRRRRATALAALKSKTCLVINRRTGEIFGGISARLDARGRPSTHRVQDLWIASLALQHGMKLLTQNRHDFEDIPGLILLSLPGPRRESPPSQ